LRLAVVLFDAEHLVWQAASFGSKIYFQIQWRYLFLGGLFGCRLALFGHTDVSKMPGSARARGQGVEIIRQMGFTYLDSRLCASR
jgi:hypothetical protein